MKTKNVSKTEKEIQQLTAALGFSKISIQDVYKEFYAIRAPTISSEQIIAIYDRLGVLHAGWDDE